MNLKEIELGHEYTDKELKACYIQIFGGVAWPGKHPGFAVVIGMGHEKHFDSYDIYLLDEFESEDIGELVRQCGALQYKYQPVIWAGDNLNDAADRLIREMNRANKPPEKEDRGWWREPRQPRRHFFVTHTPILDMKCPYPYMLSELKFLLNPDHRLLHLKDSKIAVHLSGLEASEVSALKIGESPAIEAVGLAVSEMRKRAYWFDEEIEEDTDVALRYTVNTVL